MARARSADRDRTRDPDASSVAATGGVGLGQGDEIVSLPDVTEGEPFGGGVETTVTAGESALVAEWSVPLERQAELDEIAVSAPSAATVRVDLHGMTFGPYSGGSSVTIPFSGAGLIEGETVRVRATAGATADATVKAQLTGRLY